MKKLLCLCIAFMILLTACAAGGNVEDAVVEYGQSVVYTQADIDAAAAASIESPAARVPTNSGKLSEAQDALMVLGYSRAEAQNVLKNIDTQNLGLEEIIKKALKLLM